MAEGMILKALSGFYYVDDGTQLFACRGRGKFRHEKVTPLVGDRVLFTPLEHGSGSLDGILPRKNEFQRPAVANVDQLVIIVSQAVPATDPFLIDRVISIAERRGCDSVICVNKWDLVPGEDLYQIYTSAGFTTLKVSAETGEGIEELRQVIPETHDAIISRSDYYLAHKVIKGVAPRKPTNGRRNPLSSYLVCGCCGNRLAKGKEANKTWLCSSARYTRDTSCEQVRMDDRKLQEVLLRAIWTQCELFDVKVKRLDEQKRKAGKDKVFFL